jgi:hypothetical protein
MVQIPRLNRLAEMDQQPRRDELDRMARECGEPSAECLCVDSELARLLTEPSRITGVIRNWFDLTTLAYEYRDQPYIYRGQTRAWPIQPKIGRDIRREDSTGKKLAYEREAEKSLFEAFVRRATAHEHLDPGRENEWLAVAQHYSLPTRLVDWTRGLLIAALFATKDSGFLEGKEKSVGAIYVLTKRPPALHKGGSIWSDNGTFIYAPRHVTPRIVAQQGEFTIHMNPGMEFRENVETWLISHKACFDIKRTLDTCGVTEAVLFPDTEGLAKHLTWSHKWGRDL